ncbi:MAG: DUF2177 family protein [Sphingomonas sp.]|nr:DUF2177 family protein [Sphingomonas sp.]
MTRVVVAYVATLAVFAALDFIWLTQVGPLLYQPLIGSILAPEPRMGPAILFYALYIAGLVYFAVLPGLAGTGWRGALLKGALFGFFAYATYDLTNQATLIVWSSRITMLDMAWGAFVSGLGSAGGCMITRYVVKG